MHRLAKKKKIVVRRLREEDVCEKVMGSDVSVRREEVMSGRIMIDESDWDHNVEGDAVEGSLVYVGSIV